LQQPQQQTPQTSPTKSPRKEHPKAQRANVEEILLADIVKDVSNSTPHIKLLTLYEPQDNSIDKYVSSACTPLS